VPLSAKPIMATAPISMQIAINRPLGSLILANKGPAAWSNGEPPATKEKVLLFSRSPERPQAMAVCRRLGAGAASHDQDDLSKNLNMPRERLRG
jgi:hypothetical protein